VKKLVIQFKKLLLRKVNGYSSGGATFPPEIVHVINYEKNALWVDYPIKITENNGIMYLNYDFGVIFISKKNILKIEIKNSR